MTIENFYKIIWTTRGARFQAHKRLNSVDRLSSWTINLLSIYITGIGLLAISPPDGLAAIESKTGTILISILSILILVISLLESSQKYASAADRMHSCAKELSTIYHKVAVIKSSPITDADLLLLIESYQAIIDKYDDNHKPIDFDFFRASNKSEFELNWFEAMLLKCHYVVRTHFLYIMAILSPIILLIIYWKQKL